jgi:hypothetical protein
LGTQGLSADVDVCPAAVRKSWAIAPQVNTIAADTHEVCIEKRMFMGAPSLARILTENHHNRSIWPELLPLFSPRIFPPSEFPAFEKKTHQTKKAPYS